jgi:hypothetical protein
LEDEWFASVEGFIQGIKYPMDHPQRHFTFGLVGKYAKKAGKHAENKFVWWKGEAIRYQSPEHTALIERAIRARFNENPEALRALRATEGLTLMHDVGHPDSPTTSLRREQFVDILTRIRDEHK